MTCGRQTRCHRYVHCVWWRQCAQHVAGLRRAGIEGDMEHRHLYVLDERLQPTAMLYPVGLLSGAQVEYKRVDLQSYEARKGAFLAQSFKYNFSFRSMYRRLKSTQLIQC